MITPHSCSQKAKLSSINIMLISYGKVINVTLVSTWICNYS